MSYRAVARIEMPAGATLKGGQRTSSLASTSGETSDQRSGFRRALDHLAGLLNFNVR